MGALALLAALLAPKDVRVDADLCLNRRHKDAGCRLCADACPAAAISLGSAASVGSAASLGGAAASPPSIDVDACVHCGICQAACPTGAFAVPEVDLAFPLTRARGQRSVAVACDKAGGHEASGIPCLAALTWEDMAVLALSGARPASLLDNVCDRCDYIAHGAHERIRAQVVAANSFLSTLGVSGAEVLLTSEADGSGNAVADEAVSRRDLFALWRRRGTSALADSLPERTWLDAPPPPGLPRRLPASRQRLLSLLTRHGRPGDRESGDAIPLRPTLPLASQRVGPTCDGCGLCASLCPTEALRMETGGETGSLTVQPAACVDCGLCIRVCPQHAVERGTLPTLEPLLTAARETLWVTFQHTCPRCGKVHTDPEELCVPCRKSQGLLADVQRQLSYEYGASQRSP